MSAKPRNKGRGAIHAAPPKATTPSLAFITGSHAYGAPTESSDVDLVVRCSHETRLALTRLLSDGEVDEDYGVGVRQIKCGDLNVILCSSDHVFDSWAEGTRRLRAMPPPVEREKAVALFKSLGVADPDDTKKREATS